MTTQLKPTIVQPDQGKDLRAFGNILTVLLGGDQTNETVSVVSEWTPPGGGPPLHVHEHGIELLDSDNH